MSDPKPEAVNALWRIDQWFPNMDAATRDRLRAYHSELLKFNLRLNLISRNTERDADEAHIADCVLSVMTLANSKLTSPVLDIGAGNGLPGIVLGIMRPDLNVQLVESDSRKAEFLKHAIHALQLTNLGVVHARFESLGALEGSIAITRGFATISKTCLLCNKAFPKGGRIYHLKGNNWSSEIAEIPSQLISVWSPQLLAEYTLPVSQARRAVVVTTKR